MAQNGAYFPCATVLMVLILGVLVWATTVCDCKGVCDTAGVTVWTVRIQSQTPATEESGSDSSLVFESLESALLSTNGIDSLYCIHLDRGVHMISTSRVLNSSVVLIGDQEGVVVSCSFTRQGLPSSTLHSLYFNRSQTVGFINVQAQNCPLPFRLDSVNIVLVDNSTFRFVCCCWYLCAQNCLLFNFHFVTIMISVVL